MKCLPYTHVHYILKDICNQAVPLHLHLQPSSTAITKLRKKALPKVLRSLLLTS